MKNTHLQNFAGFAIAAAGLAVLPASAMDILARVIASTPVVQQVAVPRQVCSSQAVITQAPKSGAGALMGALAGGAAGNAIGNGGGRAAATMLGMVGGAILGDQIEGADTQLQNVQQCTIQTFYENRASYYNVVYDYQGKQYTTQMASDPGAFVQLQVTPVGALPSQSFEQTPAAQPQPYFQPAPMQPVSAQPVVLAPIYPVYEPQPYYAPADLPIGLSLNLGYSQGYGGGRRGHWR